MHYAAYQEITLCLCHIISNVLQHIRKLLEGLGVNHLGVQGPVFFWLQAGEKASLFVAWCQRHYVHVKVIRPIIMNYFILKATLFLML